MIVYCNYWVGCFVRIFLLIRSVQQAGGKGRDFLYTVFIEGWSG
jgi:hypothetical protein